LKIPSRLIQFNIAIITVAIVAVTLFSLQQMRTEELRQASAVQESRMRTFWELLRTKGGEFRIVDGKLLAGDYVTNGNFELPDRIRSIFGGTATIFMGDERVSTNVPGSDGRRAIGTRLRGPAYDAIFGKGKPYRGEADILGVPYFTAYDPIRDSQGHVIGVLYVGVKKSEYLAAYEGMKVNAIIMAASLIIVFVLLSLLLMSERGKALEELRTSDERFQEALRSSRHVLYRRNCLKDCYDYISPYIENLTGYQAALFRRFSLDEISGLMHSDDRPGVFARLEYEAGNHAGGCTSLNLEYRLKKAGGDYLWVSDWTTMSIDPAGRIESLVGSLYDITDRKMAEEKLVESEQRYRGLVELSPEAIFIHVGGILVFANSQGAKLLGAGCPEELYGREALEFVHPDYRDFVRQRIDRAFRMGVPNQTVEQVFLRLDGSPVPVDVASAPFSFRGTDALQVVAREISERKKMQDELLKAQKLESLGVLAGGIAHDFNNILTGIMGSLSMARIQLDPSHPIARHLVQCEKAAVQAGKLARQLLTFSRGGEPVKKLIHLAGLIREATPFALRGSNVKGNIELADGLWCSEADEGQINQVLHNLLINAVQSMPDGGQLTIRAKNEMLEQGNSHFLPPGEYIRIALADNGQGIPRANLARIFDPYFTTKPNGSGLGLASVYSIVKRHGGTVEVTSTVGIGSCFTVWLPASSGREPVDKAVEPMGELTGKGRILVMDDERIIRDIVTDILEFIGYEVESCADGREAIERFRAARDRGASFSAVILDLTVPGGMGGRETAARILEFDPHAVLIVSSGYSSDPVVANHLQYGFHGVISKPFDASTMARELERLIALA